MSSLRDHCTPDQRRAHAILDLVRAGDKVDPRDVRWALATLGEPV